MDLDLGPGFEAYFFFFSFFFFDIGECTETLYTVLNTCMFFFLLNAKSPLAEKFYRAPIGFDISSQRVVFPIEARATTTPLSERNKGERQ